MKERFSLAEESFFTGADGPFYEGGLRKHDIVFVVLVAAFSPRFLLRVSFKGGPGQTSLSSSLSSSFLGICSPAENRGPRMSLTHEKSAEES